jgi:hypothetical protein
VRRPTACVEEQRQKDCVQRPAKSPISFAQELWNLERGAVMSRSLRYESVGAALLCVGLRPMVLKMLAPLIS